MDGDQPFRDFSRELLLRFDRSLREFSRESERRHAEAMEAIAREREDSRRHFEKLEAETAEIIAEGRAGRQALLAILDRLDGGGAQPAT